MPRGGGFETPNSEDLCARELNMPTRMSGLGWYRMVNYDDNYVYTRSPLLCHLASVFMPPMNASG